MGHRSFGCAARALAAAGAGLVALAAMGCGATLLSTLGAVAASGGGGGGGGNSPPAVAIEPVEDPIAGDVAVVYRLIDAEGNPASLALRTSLDGGRTFGPLGPTEASGLGSDGVFGLATSPAGTEHVFIWNSFHDIGALNAAEVVVEIAPHDAASGAEGPPATTAPFALVNAYIATVAGGSASGEPEGFGLPIDVAALEDGAGRALALYVADPMRHRVERIDLGSGAREVVAGTGEAGYNGDHRPADSAELSAPRGVAVGPDGDLFIADTGNHRVRRVAAATGFMTTVAGDGTAGYSGDGGLAESASFDGPASVAVDGLGNLYIVDGGNGALRVVNRTADWIRLAGSVEVEPGAVTTFARPLGPATVDGAAAGGGLLDSNSTVGTIAQPLAGISVRGLPARPGGPGSTLEAFVADPGRSRVIWVKADGKVAQAGPSSGTPLDVAIEERPGRELAILTADGKLHAVMRAPPESPLPVFEWIAGVPGEAGYAGDGGPAREALLDRPAGVALSKVAAAGGAAPVLFIADSFNRAIRAVNLGTGTAEVAGRPIEPLAIDTIAADPARAGDVRQPAFAQPAGLALGPDGALYAADFEGGKVVRIDAATRAALTLASGLSRPFGLVLEPGSASLLVSESGANRILRVSIPSGVTSVAAGTGRATTTTADLGDGGPASEATFSSPAGLALGPDGTLFIADTGNHRVRIVNGGIISTTVNAVDDGGKPPRPKGGFNGDGPPLETLLESPAAVALGPDGTLYIADTGNHRVRKVHTVGQSVTVTTIVNTLLDAQGRPLSGYNGDNRSAATALLDQPLAVALHGGTLLVADSGNHRVRRVPLASAIISTAAGIGSPTFNGDAIPPEDAALARPAGLAIDGAGNVYVSDSGNLRVRRFLGAP